MTEQGTIEQTYPHGKHPNSLANLRPWSPGQSGCPSGQRASGAYVAEWRNAMLAVNDDGTARYTRADLEAVVADDAAPPAKIIAAQWILNCMKSGENWVIGKDGEPLPARMDTEPGRERERLMDRTEGKPAQHVIIEPAPIRTPQEIRDAIRALEDAHPELMEQARRRQALPPVETTAKVLSAD